jgi:hypothetical protein
MLLIRDYYEHGAQPAQGDRNGAASSTALPDGFVCGKRTPVLAALALPDSTV